MAYAGGVVLVVVLVLGALILRARLAHAASERRMREEIMAHVTSRGGTVVFDDKDGMTVTGPLGSGYSKLTALRIMLGSKSGNRALTIGFALRQYVPDQFDAKFAELHEQALAKARGELAAMSPEELRGRLRVAIRLPVRLTPQGVDVIKQPVSEKYETRVVLEGVDVNGLESKARARLSENDDALHALALAQTLGPPPAFEKGAVDSHAWLAAPSQIFGVRPAVVAADGPSLAWLPADPAVATSAALANLASGTQKDGALKGSMFYWDGHALRDVVVVRHTIMGPTTPDFTLKLPTQMSEALGLEGLEVGVRRRG